MRKVISFVLVMLLLAVGSISAFAADVTVPSDVKGTKYETAVKELMEKIGLAGYSDGTFRPQNTIDRAEMCTIIVKAMNPTEADLKAAPSAFSDMKGYDWALQYVNYGASKKVVSGSGNGLFKPADPVTYNEAATMLVNALGYTDKDLTGTYPQNYVTKATELGIFKNVDAASKGDTAAVRGDIALMTAAVADQIVEKYKKPEPAVPETSGSAIAPSDNSAFASYGGAFGMVVDTAKVVNKDGDTVNQLEFFMNGKTYLLNTSKDSVSASPALDGSISYLKFDVNSAVKAVYNDPSTANVKHFAELTTKGAWDTVTTRSNTVITCDSSKEFNIMNDAIFYRAVFKDGSIDSYEKGSLRDIDASAKIRAYDVTDDKSDLADIVVYVTASDAAKYGI